VLRCFKLVFTPNKVNRSQSHHHRYQHPA